jgi:pimeloyl-ACP methyl ester carboxylesterase
MQSVDRRIDLGGLAFHTIERGDPAAPAVVLLHGFNQTAHSWDELSERLAAEGFRAIALDQRGHGDTDRAPDGDYSREAMADDPYRLLDALGLAQAAVVGMSMGAVHATVGAVRHPARVRAVVLVDWAPEVEARGVGVIAQVAPLSWASFDEAVEAMHRFNPRRSIDNLRARLSHSLRCDPADARWRWKVDAAGLARHPRFREPPAAMWRVLEQLAAPTLVIRGAESDLVSAELAERVASAARAELATVLGAGHSVAGDNPEAFHALVVPFLHRHAMK